MVTGCNQGSKLTLEVGVEMQVQPGKTVPPDQYIARSGDKIKLVVKPSKSGYFYVVHQGPGGSTALLYPVRGASSQVSGGQELRIPPDVRDWLQFDERTGTEQLVAIYSPAPIQKFDAVASGDGSRGINNASGEGTPASDPLATALQEVRAAAGSAASASKDVGKSFTKYKIKSTNPNASLIQTIELRHQ